MEAANTTSKRDLLVNVPGHGNSLLSYGRVKDRQHTPSAEEAGYKYSSARLGTKACL